MIIYVCEALVRHDDDSSSWEVQRAYVSRKSAEEWQNRDYPRRIITATQLGE